MNSGCDEYSFSKLIFYSTDIMDLYYTERMCMTASWGACKQPECECLAESWKADCTLRLRTTGLQNLVRLVFETVYKILS